QLQLRVGIVDAGVPAHFRRRVHHDPLPRRGRVRPTRHGQAPETGRDGNVRASENDRGNGRRRLGARRRRRPRGHPGGAARAGRGAGRCRAVLVVRVWGLAPFYWLLVTAFRDQSHPFDTTPWFPHVTTDNFVDALATDKGNDFLGAIINSLIVGGATTLIALAVGVFTAYALARLDFPGKGFVTGIILAASMFPGIALVTPLFQLFGNLGWIGTYQALIIPNISFVLPLTVYTLTSFFRDLPWELEEAARVDGATRGQAFRMVILPLAT